MKTLQRFALLPLVVALFACATALSAFADPPSRAVRLQYISGAVSIQPGGVNDWVEAVVNRPLTTADRVWTDKNARAELHLGSAALRASAETSLTLTNVSDDIVQVELDQGTLNLHIRHLFGGETYEIDTPNQAFTILKAGDYRFDVDPNADTTSVTVWRGEGEANGQGPGVNLRSGQQASFTGGTSLQHQVASAPGLDGFDDWCRVRDDREDHAKSYQYVSADVVGADELDEYGTWRTVPSYGAIWVPAVAPGWAPYHYGHWVWVEPWGWTWVDDAPWGYAPCHYGRWVYTGGYWGWAPGPMVVARPVYAPALVAWVGGPHFGVGVSFGGGVGVGWFPLGWGEPYVPSYHVSREYFQQVNVSNTHITNITTVTNNYYVTNNNTTIVNNNIQNIHYANQNVHGAMTAVPARAMTNSESVSKVAVAVPASEIRAAAYATAAPVAPARTSVLGVNAAAHAPVPPPQAVGRSVVSHAAPPPRPVPFEAKQEALAKTPGRPLDAQTEAQLRTNVMRQSPAAMSHMAPSTTSEPARPGTPATAAQPARPGMPAAPTQPAKPGMPTTATQPATPGAPVTASQPPRPGTPATAAQPPRPGVPSPDASRGGEMNTAPRPAAGATTPQPAAPGRNVPQPPSASIQPVSANGGTPTPSMNRPVPRPPQPGVSGAGSFGGGSSNPEAARPGAPSSPRPTTTEPAQPSAPSSPRPTVTDSPRPTTPRPPATPMGANSGESPAGHASQPQPDSRPANPRPPQSMGQPRQNAEPPRSHPSATPQPAPRPSASHESSSPRPAHNEQSHQQSKPEHKSENK
jgi:hypothetical protein